MNDVNAHAESLAEVPPLSLYMLVADADAAKSAQQSVLGCASDAELRCRVRNADSVAPGDDARVHRAAGHWRVLLTMAVSAERRASLNTRALKAWWTRKARGRAQRYAMGLRLAHELGLPVSVRDDVRASLSLPPPPQHGAPSISTNVFDGVDFGRRRSGGASRARAAAPTTRKRAAESTTTDKSAEDTTTNTRVKKSLLAW